MQLLYKCFKLRHKLPIPVPYRCLNIHEYIDAHFLLMLLSAQPLTVFFCTH